MQFFHSLPPSFNKAIFVLFFCGFSVPLSHAMQLKLQGSDGKSIKVSSDDAKQFDGIKDLLEQQSHARNSVILIVPLPAKKVGRMFQLSAGMPVHYLNDKKLVNCMKTALAMRATSHVIDTVEGELIRRVVKTWTAHDNELLEVISGPLINLVDLQKKVKDDKIDLYASNLESIHGCTLPPSQMKKIIEINLSSNHLSLEGLDAMKPFKLFPNLMKLSLANNQLDRLPAHFFDCIPQCAIINLANNKIKTIETDAFTGANRCAVDLCGNPIETIEPGAMTAKQNKVTVFCSTRLPWQVREAIREQLEAPDWRSKSLSKCINLATKLSRFDGYIHVMIVFTVAALCITILIPIFVAKNISFMSPTAVGVSTAYTILTVALLHSILKLIQETCAQKLEKNKNRLIIIDPKEEKNLQKAL